MDTTRIPLTRTSPRECRICGNAVTFNDPPEVRQVEEAKQAECVCDECVSLVRRSVGALIGSPAYLRHPVASEFHYVSDLVSRLSNPEVPRYD